MKYKIMPDEECHNCGTEGMPLAEFDCRRMGTEENKHLLCEICAGTHLGKPMTYPEQCDLPTLYQSIAAGFNIILKEVRKQKRGRK